MKAAARFTLPFTIATLAVIAAGCGGSTGSGTPAPPPTRGIPSIIVVSAGDQQNGVPNETLPIPLDVIVRDNAGFGVPNVPVTFSVSGGGQAFPQSSVTTETGHARALLHLPATVFAKINITASASTLSANLTATTGPRLLSTFGNVSAAHGTARPDGTYVGFPQSNDFLPGLGYDLFATDLTTVSRLGPLQGKLGVPGLYGNLWSAVSTSNQNLYFRSVLPLANDSAYIAQVDNNLNLISFSDLGRSKDLDHLTLNGPMTVDGAGNIYIAQGNSKAVLVFDSSGKKTNQISILPQTALAGIAVNRSGNLVAFMSDSIKGFAFREYSMAGDLVNSPSTQPFATLSSFAQDPAGSYLVLEDSGSLHKFDQSYNLVSTATFTSVPGFGSGQAVLSGADASGNFYVSSNSSSGLLKYDPNGSLLAVTAWPFQASCPGCPTPSYSNQLASPTAMVVDPVTSDLYVSDNSRSISMGSSVARFSNQQFSGRLNMPLSEFADDVAIGSARELYVADFHSNSIHVLDLSGNELRTIQGPQVGVPASITIDTSNNKYVLDFSTNSIHVLDASDQLSTNLNLSTPSASGTLRMGGMEP